MILDLFAGPGGWSESLLAYGLTDIGIEHDLAACQTRAAAGHLTIRADVSAYPTAPFIGKVTGLIASPPCPDFSSAGKRAGIDGESGRLIYEVPRWVEVLRPRWVACEQVPPALEWWERFASDFRNLGYMTWTGLLNAANYGVPQTRTRAFLLASLDQQPVPPHPTHARNPQPPLFGDELLPWVSMAEALGWGMTREVFHTCAPGHGDAVMAGGNAARRRLERERERGFWVMTRGDSGRPQDDFDAERPSRTLTGKSDSWLVVTGGVTSERYQPRSVNEPAPPITAAANTYFGTERAFAEGDVSDALKLSVSDALKLSVSDALKLQSFRADYPVQGTKTKQFEQIGNAVPVLLAQAVLGQVLPR